MLAGQLSKTYGLKSVTGNESQFVFDKLTYSDKNIKNNNCANIMYISFLFSFFKSIFSQNSVDGILLCVIVLIFICNIQ